MFCTPEEYLIDDDHDVKTNVIYIQLYASIMRCYHKICDISMYVRNYFSIFVKSTCRQVYTYNKCTVHNVRNRQ